MAKFERAETKKEVVEDFVLMLAQNWQKSTYHRWYLVGSEHHLLTDEEIARFLLECYDQRAAVPTGCGACPTCHSLLTLSCVNCGKVDMVTDPEDPEGSAVTASDVDTRPVDTSAVTASDVHTSAVTASDVDTSAVTASDVDASAVDSRPAVDSSAVDSRPAVDSSAVDSSAVATADQTERTPDTTHDGEYWSTDDSTANGWEVVFQESKEAHTALHQMSLRSRRTVVKKTEKRAWTPRKPETRQTSGKKTDKRAWTPRKPETRQTSGKKTDKRAWTPRKPETRQTSGNNRPDQNTSVDRTSSSESSQHPESCFRAVAAVTVLTADQSRPLGEPNDAVLEEHQQPCQLWEQEVQGEAAELARDPVSFQSPPTGRGRPRKYPNIPLECRVCGRKLSTIACVINHMKKKHPETKFPELCDSNPPPPAPKPKKGRKRKTESDTAGKESDTAEKESEAGRSAEEKTPGSKRHVSEAVKRSRKAELESLKCATCGVQFQHKKQMYTHRRLCASKVCHLCGKSVKQLEIHLKRHTSVRRFPCPHCAKSFIFLNYLEQHLLYHNNERPYCCEICGVRYREKTRLNAHIRTHTGSKPYKCTLCEAAFTRPRGLNDHMRVHTGEKPYGCQVCARQFSSSGNLAAHRRKVHGLQPQVPNRTTRKLFVVDPSPASSSQLGLADNGGGGSTAGVVSPGGLSHSGSLIKTEAVDCAVGYGSACSGVLVQSACSGVLVQSNVPASQSACSGVLVQSSVPVSQVLSDVIPTSHSLLHSSFPTGHVDYSVPISISIGHIPTVDVDSSVPIDHIPSDHVDSSVPIGHIPSDHVDSSVPIGHIPSDHVDSSVPIGHIPSDHVDSSVSIGHIPSDHVVSSVPISHMPGKVSGVYVSKEGSVSIPVLIHSAVNSAGALVHEPFHANNDVHISAEAPVTASSGAGASVGASDLVSGGHSACANATDDPLVVPQSSCATTMHPTAFVSVAVTDSEKDLVATLTDSDCKHGIIPNHMGVSISANVPSISDSKSAPTSVTVPVS